MQKEILSDPKKLVPLLNRKLYEKENPTYLNEF